MINGVNIHFVAIIVGKKNVVLRRLLRKTINMYIHTVHYTYHYKAISCPKRTPACRTSGALGGLCVNGEKWSWGLADCTAPNMAANGVGRREGHHGHGLGGR